MVVVVKDQGNGLCCSVLRCASDRHVVSCCNDHHGLVSSLATIFRTAQVSFSQLYQHLDNFHFAFKLVVCYFCDFPEEGHFCSGSGLEKSDYKRLFPVRFHHVNKPQGSNHYKCSTSHSDCVYDSDSGKMISEYAVMSGWFSLAVSEKPVYSSHQMLLENHLQQRNHLS